MKTNKVLLADDHTIVREGLRVLIETQSDLAVVGEAKNGQEALDQYKRTKPDILLLDLVLPDMCGVDVIKKLRQNYASVYILVLTTFDGEEDIYRALKAGAMGYLLKDTPKKELFRAIREVCSGNRFIPQEIASKLAAYIGEIELTARESEILQLIAKGSSNKKIAKSLFITEGTVKTHINHILKKLSANGPDQTAGSEIVGPNRPAM